MARRVRLIFGVGLVFAVLAVSSAAALAVTVPRWLVGWVGTATPRPLNTGKKKQSSILTFRLPGAASSVTCRIYLSGSLVDPYHEAGTSEVASLTLSKCTPPHAGCSSAALEVTPTGFPWQSHLVIAGSGIRDVIEGVRLDFHCRGGEDIGTFSGTLEPIVNDREAEAKGHKCHPTAPKPCALFEFKDEELNGPAGVLKVSGTNPIASEGKAIEVKTYTYE